MIEQKGLAGFSTTSLHRHHGPHRKVVKVHTVSLLIAIALKGEVSHMMGSPEWKKPLQWLELGSENIDLEAGVVFGKRRT